MIKAVIDINVIVSAYLSKGHSTEFSPMESEVNAY